MNGIRLPRLSAASRGAAPDASPGGPASCFSRLRAALGRAGRRSLPAARLLAPAALLVVPALVAPAPAWPMSDRGRATRPRRQAAAALLLLAAALCFTTPAGAQTEVEIWSGTVTVGDDLVNTSSYGYFNSQYIDNHAVDVGSINPDTFSYGGEEFVVTGLSVFAHGAPPDVTFHPARRFNGTFALYEGTKRWQLDDEAVPGGFIFSNVVLATRTFWSTGQTVSLRLVEVFADTDADLTNLHLAAPDGRTVALSPAFSSATTSYTARVPHAADRVTLSTLGASVSIAPADADASPANGHQVALPLGQTTTVTVRVTAGDGTTMKTYTVALRRPRTDVCERTPALRDAIVAQVAGVSDCAELTSAQLAGIGEFSGEGEGGFSGTVISAGFARGDFAGLSGLRVLLLSPTEAGTLPVGLFDGLTALRELWIVNASQLTRLPRRLFAGLPALEIISIYLNPKLETLPAGLFDGLSRLKTLAITLNAALTSLPSGLFRGLDSLQLLNLGTNKLQSLPPGLFGGLSSLTELSLNENELAELRPGVFDGLAALSTLHLQFNELSELPPGIFEPLTSLTGLTLNNNPGSARFAPAARAGDALVVAPGAEVVLDAGASDGGPWGSNVLYAWTQSGGADVALEGAGSATARFTAPATAGELTFELEVAGRGGGHTSTDTVTVRVVSAGKASGLALAAPDGAAIALDPAFSADTTTYAARVGPGTDRVTLTAKAGAGTTLGYGPGPDADARARGFQAALGAAGTTTAVTATVASGGSATTYTVNVKRHATDVCWRTPAVRDDIVAAVSAVSDCAALTPAHLAGIGTLELHERGIARLAAGDFAGLSALTGLFLYSNDLTGLPGNLFEGLSSLQALALNSNDLTELPPGIFDGLVALDELFLDHNDLSELPPGVFANLGALNALWLQSNPGSVRFLPPAEAGAAQTVPTGATVTLDGRASAADGPWKGNVAWAWQQVDTNGVAVTPATVTLSGAGSATPTFTAPAAPGELHFRLTVTGRGVGFHGSYAASDTVTVTVESAAVAMMNAGLGALALSAADGSALALSPAFAPATTGYTATATFGAVSVTVAWRTLHSGATVTIAPTDADADPANGHQVALTAGATQTITVTVTAEDATATMAYTVSVSPAATDVCAHTPQVREEILTQLAVSDCVAVTPAQLADIEELRLDGRGITRLAAGDFAGLPGLDILWLRDNNLTELPKGIFAGLSSLGSLTLSGNDLTELPPGIFAGLSALDELWLHDNDLTELPPGIFAGLSELFDLFLHGNDLTELPPGVFADLGSLYQLRLHDNPGSADFLPAARAGADRRAEAGAAVALDGRDSGGPWGANVTWTWTQSGGPAVALTGAEGATPSFTAPETDADLYFTLTVTGRGLGFNSFRYTDTDTVRVRVRGAGTEAVLRRLALATPHGAAVALEPGFWMDTPDYEALMPFGPVTVTVSAEASDPRAALSITPADADADPANGHQVALPLGQTTTVTVRVTAGDGTTMKTYTVALRRPRTDVCERTPAVRDAIVAAVAGVSDCADLTPAQLAGIRRFTTEEELSGEVIVFSRTVVSPGFARGDFAGLSGLRVLQVTPTEAATLPVGLFDGLTALRELIISNALQLTRLPRRLFMGLPALEKLQIFLNPKFETLPAGLFDGLSRLSVLGLSLNAALTQLPSGLFHGLDSLDFLSVGSTDLHSLPPGVFDGLASLTKLELNHNELTELRPGVFDGLAALTFLALQDNELSELPPGIFEPLTRLTALGVHGNPGSARFVPTARAGEDRVVVAGAEVVLDAGAGDGGPWGGNVLYAWTQTGGADAALEGADTATARFTAPHTAGALTFELELAGRGENLFSHPTRRYTSTATVTVRVVRADKATGLALTAPDGAAIALDPAFSADTTSYAARVRPGTDRVTLTAEAGAGTTLGYGPGPDADTTAPGHQAALGAAGTTTAVTATVASGASTTTYTVTVTRAETDVCWRTPAVRDAIVAEVAGVSDCAELTPGQLTGITILTLFSQNLTRLVSGDFAGLTSLETLELFDNDLTDLPPGIFDDLTALEALFLNDNELTELRPGVFDRLSALTNLSLSGNELTELPDRIFEPLTALDSFSFAGNSSGSAVVTPEANAGPDHTVAAGAAVTLDGSASDTGPWGSNVDWVWSRTSGPAVTLAGADTATATFTAPGPAGALVFELRVIAGAGGYVHADTVTVTVEPPATAMMNAGLGALALSAADGRALALSPAFAPATTGYTATAPFGAVSVTVAWRALHSGAMVSIAPADADPANGHQVALTAGATQTITVTVTAEDATATMTYTVSVTLAMTNVCERTPQVRDAIVAAVPGAGDCAALTPAQLAGLSALSLTGRRVARLAPGDFAGLPDLDILWLGGVGLTELPAGIFAGLARLGNLYLNGNDLTELPGGLFAGLGALTSLRLNGNDLTELPGGPFAGLSALTELRLENNDLVELPPGLFAGLTRLERLYLNGNELRALPPRVFAGLAALDALWLHGNPGSTDFAPSAHAGGALTAEAGAAVALDGADSAGPWGANVSWAWTQSGGPAVVLTGAGGATPSFTAPETDAELYFTLTVTGRGAGRNGLRYTGADTVRVRVRGLATGAVLRRLALATPDGAAVALEPGFWKDTLSYEALMRFGPATVTVSAEATDPRAAVEFAPADADADPANGHQVALAAGATTAVTVQVTSGDEATVRVYTLRVGRPATTVCERTPAVRDAIVAYLRVSDCVAVTPAQLAGIQTLELNGRGIARLAAGDFAGLSTLDELALDDNDLTELPKGLFAGLSSLDTLDLSGNDLTELPPGIFAGLSALRELWLDDNDLTALPPGVFANLGSLIYLALEDNPGSAGFLPPAEAGAAQAVATGATVTLDGRASAADGPWKHNVAWAWQQVDTNGVAVTPATVTLAGADTATPTFTAPAAAAALHFRLTVTGRGTGAEDVPYAASDTVTVTVETPAAAMDAALASLAVTHGADATVDLMPAFSPGTSRYRARVANAVARVALAPVPRQADATLAYALNGTALADADATTTTSFEVDLVEGENVIAVTVTDSTTTRDTTLTLTRNTRPTSAAATVTTPEDTAYTFSARDFAFADPDPGDALVSVTIVTPPARGALALSGTPVAASDTVTPGELATGRLVFTPAANANRSPYASFPFTVGDGADTSAVADTMTIDVAPAVDPAPALAITGTAEVGETLTADAGAVTDAQGLPDPASFTWQWVRVAADGASNAEVIADATSDSYVLTGDDAGGKLKVQVSYTDAAGNAETLESPAWPRGGVIGGCGAPRSPWARPGPRRSATTPAPPAASTRTTFASARTAM